MSRVDFIQKQFHLDGDPFNPDRDPQSEFNFKRVPLTKELDLFHYRELERFYSRVGCFGVAAQTARDKLKEADFFVTREVPPVFLIQGNRGEGKTSLATYVASLLREAGATLKRFEPSSRHFGKALLQIANMIADRYKSTDIGKELKEQVNRVDLKDPDEDFLISSLGNAASEIEELEPLIIVIEGLGYDHFEWPRKLHRVVRAFGVLLIFVTNDAQGELLTPLFEQDLRERTFDGVALKVEGLNRSQAAEFLHERFRLFRSASAPPDRSGLYPLLEKELDQVFSGQKKLTIRFLLDRMSDAFNGKVNNQGTTTALAYEEKIRNVTAKSETSDGR